MIVKVQIGGEAMSGLPWAAEILQVNFFIFDGALEPLGENVIDGPAAIILKSAGEHASRTWLNRIGLGATNNFFAGGMLRRSVQYQPIPEDVFELELQNLILLPRVIEYLRIRTPRQSASEVI